MVVMLTIWLFRKFILRKKNIPYELFVEALRSENSGHLEEAVVTYETALDEIKNARFQQGLRTRIIDKLKLLHSIIEYKRNLNFHRIA